MTFSDEARKQIGEFMASINLQEVTVENLIQTALQLASARYYQIWEEMVKENNVQGAKVCYTLYEAFSTLFRDTFKC